MSIQTDYTLLDTQELHVKLKQGQGTGSLSYPLNKTGVELVICPMQGYLSRSHLPMRFRKQR